MNAKVIAGALLLSAFAAQSQTAPSPPNPSLSSQPGAARASDVRALRQILTERPAAPGHRIGKSDFVLSSPLVEGLRFKQSSEDRSLGQKILDFPVVRMFVPQRMPMPPGGTGRYFAWGDSRRPWTAIAAGIPPGSGAAFDSSQDAPRTSLISVSW